MFLSTAEDRARLPVLLLSGFLGSGKTTLVNALLRDPRMAQTAVAINEFGEIPLDQHLIDHGQDKTIVMANGCLCCNLAGDMEDAVMRIFSRREAGSLPDFQRLIVEPSGLASPAPIAQAILRNPVMSKAFRLSSIVATVDSLFGAQQIARHPETRAQIALADTLVITKSDLASAEQQTSLRASLAGLNPAARVLAAGRGIIDPETLLPADFLNPDTGSHPASYTSIPDPGPDPHGHHHEIETISLALTADKPLNWRAFEAWLRGIRIAHSENLLRVKGILNIAQSPAPLVIQGVHHVLHPPVALPQWPDDDRRSRIVLILRGGQTLGIRPAWDAALPGLYGRAA